MKAEGEHSNIKNVIENTEGAMKNEQSGETSNKTKKNKTKARHNMCRTPCCSIFAFQKLGQRFL
jgi:hypothetical protein